MEMEKKKTTFFQDKKTGEFGSGGDRFTKEGKLIKLGETSKSNIKNSGNRKLMRKFGLSGERTYQINGKTYYGQEGKKEYEQEKRNQLIREQQIKAGTREPEIDPRKAIEPQERIIEEEKQTEQPLLQKIKNFGATIPTNERGEMIDRKTGQPIIDPKTGEPAKIHAGTVPLAPGSQLIGVEPIGGEIGSGIFKGIEKASQFITSSTGKSILAGLAGTSGIMTWLASDNLLSGISIYIRDIRNAVKFEGMDPEEAIQKIDEGMQRAELARTFIDTQTSLNPGLWPFRNLINANIDSAMISLNEHRLAIAGQQPQDLNSINE